MNKKINKLENLGLNNIKNIYYNLSYSELKEHEIRNNECNFSDTGSAICDTGVFTGRSPKDKYFVNQESSNKNIFWGDNNHPISQDIFNELYVLAKKTLSNKNIYITDVLVGASKSSQRSIRFITELAWQSHFVKNMFIEPKEEDLKDFEPDFTIYNACKATNNKFKEHNLNSNVFILFDIDNKISIIGKTWYSGEMKKGVFSLMNYWLPLENKLSMHCSANVGKDEDVALFFGLSGTGKTTLSTDSNRALIGDDEHGWDEHGIFNFEGGCYAKVINLSRENETEIYDAIKENSLLENVVFDKNRQVDYSNTSKTENTRVSYPIEHIPNHEKSLKAKHPKNIIFLTADAFGILPPVSKLNKEQAMYYYLSGYTAKVAGTEIGIKEPVATFSACFGEAFLPLNPIKYAELLGKKMDKYKVNIYLVNTGWISGAYGAGERISIKNTRACINAILDGSIEKEEFYNLDIFNLQIPKNIKNIEDKNILNPRNSWKNQKDYDLNRLKLANMFQDNFKRYNIQNYKSDFSEAGPQLNG